MDNVGSTRAVARHGGVSIGGLSQNPRGDRLPEPPTSIHEGRLPAPPAAMLTRSPFPGLWLSDICFSCDMVFTLLPLH